MGVHKQSVSFTDAAFAFARELVESGEYPNISAAVSGELARARTLRDRERTLLEVEFSGGLPCRLMPGNRSAPTGASRPRPARI